MRKISRLALLVTAVLCGAGVAGSGAWAGAAAQAPGNISTVAGGVGGPGLATKVPLSLPCGVSFAGGHLYVGDGMTVRNVTPLTDRLTTPAGTGAIGPPGDGGLATAASLQTCAATLDAMGNLVLTDTENDRVRVVAASNGTFYGQAMHSRDIYTVAGDGTSGYSGDGGPATSAELNSPAGVAVDGSGNLVLADSGNDAIRVVAASTGTFYGQAMTAGDIYTVAGDGAAGFAGDGGPATSAELSSPRAVAVDGTGNLVLADFGNDRIRVVAASTGTFYGQAMTAGDIYTVAGDGAAAFSGDGGLATSAGLDARGVAVDGSGNLVLADTANNRARVVAASTGTYYGQAMTAGNIYTVAGNGTAGVKGDGKPATRAELNGPNGVTVDAAGNLVIADTGNRQLRVVAASSGTFYTQAMTGENIYTVAGHRSSGYVGDGGTATAADLASPGGLTLDAAGNMVIADTASGRVRVVAASTGTFYGQAMTVGDIYTVAGNGAQGFRGDGGPATSAGLDRPQGVAVDAAGNLVIADTLTGRVRVVAASTGTFYGQAMAAGDIYTVAGGGTGGLGDGGPAIAAELGLAYGVAVDAAGNLVIATSHNRIRVVAASTGTFYGQAMTAGDIYTVAGKGAAGFSGDGGPATMAELAGPGGVAVDAAGNVVIADTLNNRVRVVAATTGTFYGQAMTAGDIYTVAGGGTGGLGDGGPATSAELASPVGVVADAAGNLVIGDEKDNRIRVVAASTGTFYGQAMTGGDIYTLAGDGTQGFAGDGGPASGAELNLPEGVAVDGAGDVLIADSGDNRVRLVVP